MKSLRLFEKNTWNSILTVYHHASRQLFLVFVGQDCSIQGRVSALLLWILVWLAFLESKHQSQCSGISLVASAINRVLWKHIISITKWATLSSVKESESQLITHYAFSERERDLAACIYRAAVSFWINKKKQKTLCAHIQRVLSGPDMEKAAQHARLLAPYHI